MDAPIPNEEDFGLSRCDRGHYYNPKGPCHVCIQFPGPPKLLKIPGPEQLHPPPQPRKERSFPITKAPGLGSASAQEGGRNEQKSSSTSASGKPGNTRPPRFSTHNAEVPRPNQGQTTLVPRTFLDKVGFQKHRSADLYRLGSGQPVLPRDQPPTPPNPKPSGPGPLVIDHDPPPPGAYAWTGF